MVDERRDAREAEGARLEIVYSANNGIEGSNPSLSAMHHVGCMAALNLTWFRAPSSYHVGFVTAVYHGRYTVPSVTTLIECSRNLMD